MKVDGVFINNQDQTFAHMVSHFENLFDKFSILPENSLVEEVIPYLVTYQINSLLTSMPSVEEIQSVVFNLKRDSVAGLDGFGPIFYQKYWSIIKDVVIKETLQFFKEGRPSQGFRYLGMEISFKSLKAVWRVLQFQEGDQARRSICEDVLSRGLSQLVANNRLKLSKACMNVSIPSHTLYIDDILLFTKGGPIFKGRPKASYFQSVADKIRNKLAAWKASLLSIAGRVKLGLKDEGLGIKSLRDTNEANNLVRCWIIIKETYPWAFILKARVFRRGQIRGKINLWCDNWCGHTLASLLQILDDRLLMLKVDLNSILWGNSLILPNALISLCFALPKSGVHLPSVWDWLGNILNLRKSIGNLDDCLTVMCSFVSIQCKVLIRVSVIAAIYDGNSDTGTYTLAIGDFVNVYGACDGVPVKAACGGISRDHLGNHAGSFACNLGHENALFAKLMGVILAIEHSSSYG
ncbi:hypothetical protein KIW84_014883 [Lathyrus oleraceus]|uniref:Uncharacterized protein n=1 Tax=Pisum sativum TaxID=3888 RepID=A0A9D5GZZ4_PEA|nr:hypothetical protein KIW84_014883 [Pisum sativum]